MLNAILIVKFVNKYKVTVLFVNKDIMHQKESAMNKIIMLDAFKKKFLKLEEIVLDQLIN